MRVTMDHENPHPPSKRGRIRDVLPNLRLGKWRPGKLNSITDVPDVLVHTESIQPDGDVNTGVTTILHRKDWTKYSSFGGVFSFNGCGEMTGAHWINETGLVTCPIIITTTSSVGDAYRGVWEYCYREYAEQNGGEMDLFIFPIAAETFDGYLSDQSRFALTPQHVVEGIKKASSERVPEGNTGGGTGMVCHRFKGGTGSSSRLVDGYDAEGKPKTYSVGVLVQANYGNAENLHIGGIPVGAILKEQGEAPSAKAEFREPRKDGSIIIVIATDVPLLPVQLQRLAKRATIGLGKVGGYGSNSSGDIFLAFSNAAKIPFQELPSAEDGVPVTTPYTPAPFGVKMLDNDTITGVFEAAADATEEAIYNALFMAEDMVGFKGRRVNALDLERVKDIVNKRL